MGISTRTGRLVALLLAVLLTLPSAVGFAQTTEQQLDDVKERLERTREGLKEIDRQRGVTVEDLQRIDAELSALDANLAALQAELAAAQAELVEAEQRLAATTSQLVATEQRLGETRQRIRGERETFTGRTRASFMFGGPAQMTSAMFDAADAAEFGRAIQYVQRVLATDRDRITLVSGLAREIEADTVELGVLQDRQASERAAAEGNRDRVAGLVEEERSLREQVVARRTERQAALNELDTDRANHIAMADSLEAESERLEEELRRRAEEERRRREEEERRQRAEAERRRQQEEAARRTATAQRSQREQGSVSAAPQPSGRLQRPADGRVTSGYGWRTHPIFGTRRLHAGVDFGGGYGAPIYAAEAGTVVSVGARGGYGLTVILDHGAGMTTLYAHQSRFAVSAGQRVTRGQVIGYIGSTGFSTGPHLHFEVRINGATRDPMSYL